MTDQATATRTWSRPSSARRRTFIHAQVNVYRHPLLEELAGRLAELAPGAIDTWFFANSGAEATEGP